MRKSEPQKSQFSAATDFFLVGDEVYEAHGRHRDTEGENEAEAVQAKQLLPFTTVRQTGKRVDRPGGKEKAGRHEQ